MAQKENPLKKLKFDKRLINLNLKKGELTQQEYDSHLKSLEDCADRSKMIKVNFSSGNDTVN